MAGRDGYAAGIEQVIKGGFSLMLRHRLHCTIVRDERSSCCGGSAAEGDGGAAPSCTALEHEVQNLSSLGPRAVLLAVTLSYSMPCPY